MTAEESQYDVVVIGGGPAGLAAAVRGRALGLDVHLIDEQEAPGGQIYREIEAARASGRAERLGADYASGGDLVARFRASGASYAPDSQVWQIEPSWQVFVSRSGETRRIGARHVLVAVGAIERPVPFKGWTTPGVMTVGAAQILLKSAGMAPKPPFWIAGQGPLVLLYTAQLIDAGVRPDGLLLTTPAGAWSRGVRHGVRALGGASYLSKGMALLARVRKSGIPVVTGVDDLEAIGGDRLEGVRYLVSGASRTVAASTLLVHEGVVPNAHMTMALGCAHTWDEAQLAPRPVVDDLGMTSVAGISAAGDCAGIIGAEASAIAGEIAAIGIARSLGRIAVAEAQRAAGLLRAALRRHLAVRPFLDAVYRPRPRIRRPADDVIVCRCEERTARDIRDAVRDGCIGPNQAKAFTRAGMGPCQGRECALTVTELVAEATGTSPGAQGFMRIRPPLKPVTLGELAMLETTPAKDMP